ncbi:MAG: response regulator [Spirochaetes bacterium]|nr:response regulator [Spirochaetota bacterium]
MNNSVPGLHTILLIEDNPGDARLIEEMIAEINQLPHADGVAFRLVWKPTLQAGLAALRQGDIHLILLDLSLPDSQGFETFRRTQEGAPGTPLILLTGQSDEKMAMAVVRAGAQDFLHKNGLTAFYLARAMRYAIERKSFAEEIKQLSQRILQVREEERSSLSQELHDGLGQSLLALKLQLQSRLAKLEKQTGVQIAGETSQIISYLDEILQEVRTISHNLSPIGLKGLGIAQAIWQLAQRFSHAQGPEIIAEVDALENFFPENWDINTYRIVEQALVNAVKHARASRIVIAVRPAGSGILVSVSDDGTGMDLAQLAAAKERKGLGLHIMKERGQIAGGVLQIVSEPGKGSLVQIEIPARV